MSDSRRFYEWAEIDTSQGSWVHTLVAHNLCVRLRPESPDGHVHMIPAVGGDISHMLAGACECQPSFWKAPNARVYVLHRSPIMRLKVPEWLPARI